MSCKLSPGYFKGVYQKEDKLVNVNRNLSCKSWKCPDCAPLKVKEVKKRISRGAISAYQKNRNYVKLVTLTCPGRAFRDQYTSAEAYDLMSRALHQVITLLKRKVGDFEYLKVTEKQKDGYPHFHILLVGKNIASKHIKQDIENLWIHRYGMGFMKINILRDHKHGVNYILKYLVKGMEPIRKYARVFSSSRGALAPAPTSEIEWLQTRFYYGKVGVDDVQEIDLTDFLGSQKFLFDLVNRLISYTP